MRNIFPIKLLTLLILFMSGFLKAAAQLIADGLQHTVVYNGTYQDFVIPDNPLLIKVQVRLFGADGGAASVTVGQYIPFIGFEPIKTCSSGGGAGAFVSFIINVGSKPQEIPWGSTLRFIIGGKGVSGHVDKNVLPDGGTGYDYGGGGGGTALLYRESENHVWKLLGVAGGGGGAYQGMV